MNHLRIDPIGRLMAVPPGPLAAPRLREIEAIDDAALIVRDGRIAWFGPARDAPPPDGAPTVDARGACVIPGLIDCHTHAVFAGGRAAEFVQKIEGRGYLEILQSGGGIHSTVAAVRAADEAELLRLARPRLARMLREGVTTIEIKSGYGLSAAEELKMLRVVRRLADEGPQEVVGTYLAAHTIPKEFAGRADAYLDAVTAAPVLNEIRRERLAEFADVFCEAGAFSVEQSERFLTACRGAGLRPKVHADQLSSMGASEMAARVGAVSVDHLEFVDDAAAAALRAAQVIPVLLPGCSLFMHTPPADARRLVAARLPVALATDFNPGSCYIPSLRFVMALGCMMLRLTPAEALAACTANAAAALGRQDRLGAIAVGHAADLVVLDAPSIEQAVYDHWGTGVRAVIKSGQVV